LNSYIGELLYHHRPEIQAFYISGSHAYGTNDEHSDIDYRGVMMPNESQIFGMETYKQLDIKEHDITIFEMRRFFHLACKANPNILELLFIDRHNHILKETDLWKQIKSQRYLFLSKKVKHTYGGYAYSQSKRLTMFAQDATSNPNRIKLIEQFGYDTKKAMHLIRLLKTGIEILTEGTIHVFRPDKRQLLDIKHGKYSLKEIQQWEKNLRDQLDMAYLKSQLPNSIDFNRINNLLIHLMKEYFYD